MGSAVVDVGGMGDGGVCGGTPGNWGRGRCGLEEKTGPDGKNGMGCLGLAAWPRRSGASEGEWDLPFQPVIDFGRAESRPRRTTTGTSEMGA